MIYIAGNVLNGIVEVAGRVGFAYPLTGIAFTGQWGVWLTTGLTWFVTGILSWLRYLQGKWKMKSLIK